MPPVKRSVRILLILLLSGLLLYVLLLAILGLSPQVNDRDLQATREPVPEEANAFGALQKASGELWWPDEQKAALSELARDTNWDAAFAAKVLQNNRQALAALDAAFARPACQVPEYQWPDGANDPTYLNDWRQFAQLEAIRGNALFHAGQERQAFDHALNLVRLGARLQDAGGVSVHYLVGMAVKSQGLHQMQRWTARTRLEPRQLAELAKQLQGLESVETALGNTLKIEYQGQMRFLGELRAGRRKSDDAAPWVTVKLLPVFNYGKTKRLMADRTRLLLGAIPTSYAAAKLPNAKRPSPLGLILSGNLSGQVFYWNTLEQENMMLRKKCQEIVQIRVTRLELALRACQLKQGALPTALAALVPGFLEAVPLDEFDGQALRYLPDQKLIYSVSENLRDDGGIETDKQMHRPDYVFPFAF
jgi:hypothetical protein